MAKQKYEKRQQRMKEIQEEIAAQLEFSKTKPSKDDELQKLEVPPLTRSYACFFKENENQEFHSEFIQQLKLNLTDYKECKQVMDYLQICLADRPYCAPLKQSSMSNHEYESWLKKTAKEILKADEIYLGSEQCFDKEGKKLLPDARQLENPASDRLKDSLDYLACLNTFSYQAPII